MGLKPIGVVLAALLAASCNTEDESPYDIPIRSALDHASLEIGPDGSPVVFAEVGMNFATAVPVSGWEPRYQMRNLEVIAYAPGAHGWEPHSFRNFQPYAGSSNLLVNSKGEIEALVENLHRLMLYSRKGAGWELKRSVLEEARDYGWGGYDPWSQGRLVLSGDSAWETLDQSYGGNPPRPQLGIKRNDGTLIVLDTVSPYSASLLVPGKRSNYLLDLHAPTYGDTGRTAEVLSYRWSLDPAHPDPRKQAIALEHPPSYGGLFSFQVSGETRVYCRVSRDSLAEFGFRGDTLSLLGYRFFHQPAGDSVAIPNLQYGGGSLSVDPSGCIHSLGIGEIDPPAAADTLQVLVHSSSCEAGVDTVSLPRPAPLSFNPPMLNPRFAADGSLVLAVALVQRINWGYPGAQDSPPASWLYLARRSAAKKWTWEQVAAY